MSRLLPTTFLIFGKLLRRHQDDLLLAASGLLIVWVLFFTAPVVTESVDYVLFYQANFQFLKEAMLEGRVPLWNPYVGLGRPFLADVQNAVFYPPVYLTLLGPGKGLFLLIWLHVLLALFGMRALGRAWGMSRPVSILIALSFAGSLILTGRFLAGQLLYACALCYLPVLFGCANRIAERWNGRLAAIHALLLALQFLCGHPQVFWFSTLGQVIFVLVRSPGLKAALLSGWRFGLVSGLALGLIAIALLSFLELVGQGNRALPSTEFASFGRMEWFDLFALLTDPPPGRLVDWEKNLFIGAVMVVAGLAGLTRLADGISRGLLATLIFSVLVAVADQTPFFTLLFHGLPGYSGFRVHVRAAALIAFVLLIAAGRWLSRPEAVRRDWITLSIAGMMVLALLGQFCRQTAGRHPGLPLAFWFTLVSTGVLLLGLAVRGRSPRLRGLVLAAVFLLQAVDLMNANLATRGGYAFLNIQGVSPDFPHQTELAGFLKANNRTGSERFPARVVVDRKTIPANFGMMHHYGSVDAYTSLFLRRPWDYLHGVMGLEAPKLKNTSVAGEFFRHEPFSRPELAVEVGMHTNSRSFQLNPSPGPRVFATTATEGVGSAEEAIRRLRSGHEVRRVTLVEQPLPRQASRDGLPEPEVRLIRWTPNAISLEVNAPQAAVLVMAEAWYPGWKARVGSSEVDSFPANAWMRAFPIPAGRERVEVFFHQNHLLPGAAISIVSLAVCLFLLRRGTRKPDGKLAGSSTDCRR